MKSMKCSFLYLINVVLIVTGMTSGCIHEKAYLTPGGQQPGGGGVDPTSVNAYIEVNYDLSWENLIHRIEFDAETNPETRAASDNTYRFVIEVIYDDAVVCRDFITMKGSEVSLGQLRHHLSKPLEARFYQIAVWCDLLGDNGRYPFNADNLSQVGLLHSSTMGMESLQCGYATDMLDLRDITPTERVVTKSLEMGHPGGRFEIVATDIQEFISAHKEDLYNNEEFNLHLSFSYPASKNYNLYSGNYAGEMQGIMFTGSLILPYAEYEELKIAEGFLFCREGENANLSLRVTDSALSTVVQTSEFSFPLRQGYVTTVKGNFLTGSLDGGLSIDHLWEGEIVINL